MASGKTQEELEVQINNLHSQLEKLGVNSSGQKGLRFKAQRRLAATTSDLLVVPLVCLPPPCPPPCARLGGLRR